MADMDSVPSADNSADEDRVARSAGQWIGFAVVLLVFVAGGYYVASLAGLMFAFASNGESAWAALLPLGGWIVAIVAALVGAGIAYRAQRSPWVGMGYAGGIFFAALFAGLLVSQA